MPGLLRHQLPVYSPISVSAIAAARRATASDAATPLRELSAFLCRTFGSAKAVLLGSGTQALTAGLRVATATREHRGPVALPGYACYDLATAAVGAGASVVLYDIDPATLGPDLVSVEKALRAGARVLVAAHLYGIPCDWDSLRALADQYGAIIIEDAAQAAGGEWRGRRLGSLGDLAVLSFGRGKGWTGGGGGALLLGPGFALEHAGAAEASTLEPLRAAFQWLLGRPATYGLPRALPWLHLGETRYQEPRAVASITRFQAALALATEPLGRAELATRRHNARHYLDAGISGTPNVSPAATPGWLRFPVLLPPRRSRELLLRRLRPLGVECGYPGSLNNLEALVARLSNRPLLPGAELLARNLITLPTHSRTLQSDLRSILSEIRKPATTN